MNQPYPARPTGAAGHAYFDEGLRQHMLRVYNVIGLGLVLTGLVAFAVVATPALAAAVFGTPLRWVATFAPLAFVMFFSFRIERMSASAAQMAF